MENFGWSRATADLAVIVIRKSVHFGAYGLMGLSLFLFARSRRSSWTPAVLGVAWAVAHGALDEFRQSLSLARTGSALDVLIDALGAATLIAIAARWARRP
jgi:VanZ family protein